MTLNRQQLEAVRAFKSALYGYMRNADTDGVNVELLQPFLPGQIYDEDLHEYIATFFGLYVGNDWHDRRVLAAFDIIAFRLLRLPRDADEYPQALWDAASQYQAAFRADDETKTGSMRKAARKLNKMKNKFEELKEERDELCRQRDELWRQRDAEYREAERVISSNDKLINRLRKRNRKLLAERDSLRAKLNFPRGGTKGDAASREQFRLFL